MLKAVKTRHGVIGRVGGAMPPPEKKERKRLGQVKDGRNEKRGESLVIMYLVREFDTLSTSEM